MYSVEVENEQGERLELTHHEEEWQVVGIEGLDPPNATISTSPLFGADGSILVNSRLETRNVVITMRINGDAETERLRLYKWFKTKRKLRIYYSNGSLSVYTEGYIDTVECSLFENGQTMQASIICMDPYFYDTESTEYDVSAVKGGFEFPFAIGAKGLEIDGEEVETTTDSAIPFGEIASSTKIYNDGDSTGVVILLRALRTIEASPIVITNERTGGFFGIDAGLESGGCYEITTISGRKSLYHIDGATGERTNFINHMVRGSTWLQLESGSNEFSISVVGSEYLDVKVVFTERYEAV